MSPRRSASIPPTGNSRDGHLRMLDSSALTEEVLLRMESDDLEGTLCARSADRRTPDGPSSPLAAVFIVVGIYTVRESLRFRMHRHPSFELNLVDSGRWEVSFGGPTHRLGPGDAVLVHPDDEHEDRVAIGTRYRGLRFTLHDATSGEAIPGILAGGAPDRFRILRGIGPAITSLLDALHGSADLDNPFASLIQDAKVLELVWRIATTIPAAYLHSDLSVSGQHPPYRRAMLAWFREHAARPESMAVMAADLGISGRTLRARAKDCFGTNPAQAFIAFRLAQARRLLAEPGATVQGVSQRLGFLNPYHFSRAYRRCFGHAPSRRSPAVS